MRMSILAVVIAASVAGCASSPTYTLPESTGPGACLERDDESRDLLVGLSVSGGGSRAALFGVGGMEALGRLKAGPENRSVLERVSYISAVSGGSMASTYYVFKKPGAATPMLAPDGSLTSDYEKFFAAYRSDLAGNFEGPMIRRQLSHFRWANPAWMARSLSEILHERHIGDATYAELAEREARGDSPRLLVNTTLYNDGRRLVFTTARPDDVRFDFPAILETTAAGGPLDAETRTRLQERWQALESRAPGDLGLDVCGLKVASTVVASMSYPPYIGPITFKVGEQERYWHAGDGGLADNSGTESLFMLALRQLQEKKAKRALIISLDSSFPFAVGGRALDTRSEGFSRMNNDFSRLPSIMEERANAYRAFFLRMGQVENLLPEEKNLEVIVLRHTDAEWQSDLSDVPATCRQEHPEWRTPADVNTGIAEITTRLYLKSACDRELVLAAATKVVNQNADRIRRFVEQ